MIKKEQNLVVEKTHQRVQSVDVDQLVQPVKITKEEQVNLVKRKSERQEHFLEKKIKDYMDGLKGEDNYELGNYIKRIGLP